MGVPRPQRGGQVSWHGCLHPAQRQATPLRSGSFGCFTRSKWCIGGSKMCRATGRVKTHDSNTLLGAEGGVGVCWCPSVSRGGHRVRVGGSMAAPGGFCRACLQGASSRVGGGPAEYPGAGNCARLQLQQRGGCSTHGTRTHGHKSAALASPTCTLASLCMHMQTWHVLPSSQGGGVGSTTNPALYRAARRRRAHSPAPAPRTGRRGAGGGRPAAGVG